MLRATRRGGARTCRQRARRLPARAVEAIGGQKPSHHQKSACIRRRSRPSSAIGGLAPCDLCGTRRSRSRGTAIASCWLRRALAAAGVPRSRPSLHQLLRGACALSALTGRNRTQPNLRRKQRRCRARGKNRGTELRQGLSARGPYRARSQPFAPNIFRPLAYGGAPYACSGPYRLRAGGGESRRHGPLRRIGPPWGRLEIIATRQVALLRESPRATPAGGKEFAAPVGWATDEGVGPL
jgi:hypothetical protein